jgi:pectin methylesterase-like acyl-CoA thioesterase
MIGLLASIALFLVGTSYADTIIVCQVGCNFTSIQEAIDASDPGDLIEVQSGVYYEALNITKQVILRGVDTGKGKPVIDAGMTHEGKCQVQKWRERCQMQ